MEYLQKNLSMYHNIHYKYQRTTSAHLPSYIVEHSAGMRVRLWWDLGSSEQGQGATRDAGKADVEGV